MPDSISSCFNISFYIRAFLGAAAILGFAGYLLYHCISGSFAAADGYFYTAFLCGGVWLYYYFSKSCQRIVVADTGITVFRVFKKPLTIPWADITAINTYTSRSSTNPARYGYSRDFVIEFNHNQTISFNEAWYDNYSQLTMAIYLHKYGPGHGRERYLARHGKNA